MNHKDLITKYNLTNFVQFYQTKYSIYYINDKSIIYRLQKKNNKIYILKPSIRSYTDKSLCVKIDKKKMNIHSIMGTTFLGLKVEDTKNHDMTINHINHNHYCNHLNNLEIITAKQNKKHYHSNTKEEKQAINNHQRTIYQQLKNMGDTEQYINFVLNV